MARYIQTQKGAKKLSFEGHNYTKQRASGTKTFWICHLRKTCNGRAVSEEAEPGVINARVTKEHQHAPSTEEGVAIGIRNSIKRRALDEPASNPGVLIREELADATAPTLVALPKRQTLRRMINRQRCSIRPANPRSLEDLQIVEPYCKTLTGELFLLYDNQVEMEEPQPSRIVIFASDQNIRLLFSSADWFSDGTFSIVPSLFYQL